MINQLKTKVFKNLNVQIFSIGLIAFFIIIASYSTGKLITTHDYEKLQLAKLRDSSSLENELESTKNRLSIVENTNKINMQTTEQTRQIILQLEQQIYQQQKDIISYKTILSKKKSKSPLVFRDLIIQATDQPDTYRFKLILTRLDQANTLLNGHLKIDIIGTINKKTKVLSLTSLTNNVEYKKAVPFSFRYMAMIPAKDQFAEFTLPKNFTPKTFKVTANLSHKNIPITHTFDWLVAPSPIQEIEDFTN